MIRLRNGQVRCQKPAGHVQFCGVAGISTHEAAAESTENKGLLVRDYIHSALYEPHKGYFAAKSNAVGAIAEPIRFDRIPGRAAYNEYLSKLYKQHDIAWFTPVEVFQPWYGYAVAEYILRTMDPSAPLKIYEVGGGTGTCANNILTYFKLRAPNVYKSMTYTSVEISAALAKKQKARVETVISHRGHFMVNCGSASDARTWGTVNASPCYIIMFEVLDNLPHDLVYRETPKSPWLETWVVQDQTSKNYVEERRPLQDPLIKRCLDVTTAVSGTSSLVASAKSSLSRLLHLAELSWIPTGCLQLLETLHRMRPNMALITSDFSSLPDVTISGARAPIVASKENGETKDHSTYLEAMGNADIFFPTDFQLLERLDHYSATLFAKTETSERISTVVTSAEFMEQCAQVDKTKTLDGFNPLLEDYSNTKFYINLPTF
uniref:Protein arginine methyltransferase NDUFAF7 n=1 Tax=Physcomitrium patens TaxID=3218 RepID=A0A7I4ESK1_PHYPA